MTEFIPTDEPDAYWAQPAAYAPEIEAGLVTVVDGETVAQTEVVEPEPVVEPEAEPEVEEHEEPAAEAAPAPAEVDTTPLVDAIVEAAFDKVTPQVDLPPVP